ncbi:hypothetical protein O6H91_12G071400 [Diphasiastrum complanatum]|uniref:Uncharacterized protein n=1 Tax=Diphasiastrum complanatum TaxID=34168 RepID=A0ACC2C366_DIPCM|nr:hypothetical protein O6H91_Y190600 [Diphasiastrum complanatum]KAJ7536488.1 hypothetical protein O6H91_12G071400 [Diphasiastrum complanatum]
MATAQVPGMEAPLPGPVAAKKKTLMRAMVLESPLTPLKKVLVEVPEPACDQIRVRVLACAVCRTDLHVVDGDLKEPKLPIIPGHEIVGVIDAIGPAVDANRSPIGTRVGIPWLGRTCGSCFYCLEGAENLCDSPGFTGYQIDGGYAEYTVAHANYCFPLPDTYSDVEIAPFLCAGLIGYRSLKKTGFLSGEKNKKNIGIYGFGAAGHIIAQVAIFEGHGIYAFTRSGDTDAQKFALQLGARWAGDSATLPPVELDAAIIFAPVGSLIPAALRAVRKGGIVVAGGIHMSNIPSFPYSILWGERQVVSVANLKRQDAVEFLLLASKLPLKTETTVFPLEQANEALASLREGRLQGAAVLVP